MHTALLLEMAAQAHPERIALGSRDGGIDFAELAARAKGGATALAGLSEGTVVFVGLNGPTLPVAIFAAGLLGRAFAPLNYRLSDRELQRLLTRTAPSVAVVDDDMLGRFVETPGVTLLARSDFEDASLDRTNRAAVPGETAPDIAVMLFTSGTTGEPKAALLRHRHLASYVISTVDFMGAGEGEAALASVPPYHIAGISAVLTSVYCGRRIVHLPIFTPETWVRAAAAEQISHAMVVPTMLEGIIDVLERSGERLPNLKALAYGGGRMPQGVIQKALKLLPHVGFVNAYGLTETSSTIAMLSPEDHRRAIASKVPAVQRRLRSVGRPLARIDLEIRGPSREALPAGESGEVYVRGEQVAGEYIGRKLIGEDGWFATNDEGWLDDEGYLFVEGRLDDVIVRGGENISPGEIEDVLRAHPDVAEVAVVGVPDDHWGESLVAVVVARGPTPTEEHLTAWAKARLRSTKAPERYEFRTELPYNDTGKLLRRLLKQELARTAPARRSLPQ